MENREDNIHETNLLEYFNLLKKNKKLIITIVCIAVIATGVYSFLSPKIYKSKAVIVQAARKQEPSSMSALASQFGITSPQTSNVSEIVALLKSNILMEKVIKKYNLISVLFSKEKLMDKKEEIKVWDSIRYMKTRIIRVNHNKMEGIIELTAEFKDPKISAKILNYILTELTEYMSSEAKRVADTNKAYLESLIDKNSDPLIQQKIYSLIAQQIETSMMAEVKENFAFKILDPPKVPDKKIRPKIRSNLTLAFFVSLFACISLAFILEYYRNLKELQENSKK